jgi:RNA polymerase sigma factor (sigma-70 family)
MGAIVLGAIVMGANVMRANVMRANVEGANVGQERRLAGLMRAAQGGDSGAYCELLRALAPLVREAVKQRLRFLQAQDVEDLVQETLLSLHTARRTYDPTRPFLPWFMAIARNRVADSARQAARRMAHEVLSERHAETFAAEDANNPATGYGDVEALGQAMRKLPPGQRRAIELMKLRQLSLKEAAAAAGTSIGALKVSVHRGMSALRKALGARD